MTKLVRVNGDRGHDALVGDRARSVGSSTVRFASENLLPLSLVGLGLSWLVRSTHGGKRTTPWPKDARERLIRSGQRTAEHAHDNPLLLGALAMGAGVGLGLTLPATRQGDQLLGHARERLVERIRTFLDEDPPGPDPR